MSFTTYAGPHPHADESGVDDVYADCVVVICDGCAALLEGDWVYHYPTEEAARAGANDLEWYAGGELAYCDACCDTVDHAHVWQEFGDGDPICEICRRERSELEPPVPVRTCAECGCTEEAACLTGSARAVPCWWMGPTVCSACVGKVMGSWAESLASHLRRKYLVRAVDPLMVYDAGSLSLATSLTVAPDVVTALSSMRLNRLWDELEAGFESGNAPAVASASAAHRFVEVICGEDTCALCLEPRAAPAHDRMETSAIDELVGAWAGSDGVTEGGELDAALEGLAQALYGEATTGAATDEAISWERLAASAGPIGSEAGAAKASTAGPGSVAGGAHAERQEGN